MEEGMWWLLFIQVMCKGCCNTAGYAMISLHGENEGRAIVHALFILYVLCSKVNA